MLWLPVGMLDMWPHRGPCNDFLTNFNSPVLPSSSALQVHRSFLRLYFSLLSIFFFFIWNKCQDSAFHYAQFAQWLKHKKAETKGRNKKLTLSLRSKG